ncbi:hypothetical protein [Priestia sp. YIM B13489]|uniref:hypothetical protein n=1 Tax=Priestia sp. YIM B13489 TaxID=3366313 RepID=UPI00366EC363
MNFFKKKELFYVLSFLSFALMLSLGFSSQAQAATVKGFNFKPGDILITKSTSSDGIAGHSAIVDQTGSNIIHIAGYGHTPARHPVDWFLNNYKATKVVRYKSATLAKKAGTYAYNNYYKGPYKNHGYGLAPNPKDTTKLYCSEIVWQSYYYGAGVTFYGLANKPIKKVIPSHIMPYDYIGQYEKMNGYSTVKSFNW